MVETEKIEQQDWINEANERLNAAASCLERNIGDRFIREVLDCGYFAISITPKAYNHLADFMGKPKLRRHWRDELEEHLRNGR